MQHKQHIHIANIALSAVLYAQIFTLPGLCDEMVSHFDGSEFSKDSFRDASLEPQEYTGVMRKRIEDVRQKHAIILKGDDEGIRQKKTEVSDSKPAPYPEEQMPRIHALAQDWVPEKVDVTNSGGFGLEPPNGSPVPYNLNGHVDLEAGKP